MIIQNAFEEYYRGVYDVQPTLEKGVYVAPLDAEDTYWDFQAGWEACLAHQKKEVEDMLKEFDNDDNDCGGGGCII